MHVSENGECVETLRYIVGTFSTQQDIMTPEQNKQTLVDASKAFGCDGFAVQ